MKVLLKHDIPAGARVRIKGLKNDAGKYASVAGLSRSENVYQVVIDGTNYKQAISSLYFDQIIYAWSDGREHVL